MHPNAQPLEEAQRQLNLLLQQQEELAPGLYRDLALYLQVLREGLLPAVQQACFHLATQVVPERYKELPSERRHQFQQRLVVLVRRCSTLLTVEQLMGLAAQQHRRDLRRRASQRQRLMQALLEAPDADSSPTSSTTTGLSDGGPAAAQPPGSVQLGLDLPVAADLFDSGIPGLPRPAVAPVPEPAPEPSGAEMELQLMQSLFQMASAGLGQELLSQEQSGTSADPATAAPGAAAGGSGIDATLASLEQPSPPDPRVTASSLPRDPLLQWSWWTHFDRALSRRLRNLSHALNVEMMRLGLAQGLLPLNLLDGVLEGQVEALPAPANLLRLPLPLPGSAAPAEVLTVLLRPSDLEYEQPRLRTCRRRLEQRRRELRTMARRYRVWQRRVVALEAEQQWFRDSAQHQTPPLPPS